MKVDNKQDLSREYHRCYDGISTRGKDLLMTNEERDRAMDFRYRKSCGFSGE